MKHPLTKFVKKLRELNKGKHMQPKGPYEALQGYTGLYRTIRDNMRPYKTIRDHSGTYWSIQYHTGPYRTIQDHTGPYSTIKDHIGRYRTIREHAGPHRIKQDHKVPYMTIQDHKVSYRIVTDYIWAISVHKEPCNAIQAHPGPYGTIHVLLVKVFLLFPFAGQFSESQASFEIVSKLDRIIVSYKRTPCKKDALICYNTFTVLHCCDHLFAVVVNILKHVRPFVNIR